MTFPAPPPPGPTWNPEQQAYDYPSGQPSAPPHVGQPYPGQPEPRKPRKIWPARHPVLAMWIGLGILGATIGVIGIVAVNSSTNNPRTDVAAVPSASPEPRITATQSADGIQETTPAPPELTSAAPKAWRTVATLGGSTNKRGPAFTLHGGQARLSYTARDTSGFGAVLVTVYVMDEGTSLAKDGGFPEVTVTDPGPGSTELANPAGRYYLDVGAANARWTVTVQELS